MNDARLIGRLFERLCSQLNGCWFWRGYTNWDGYGKIRVAGRSLLVHRLMYELLVGPIPDGFELDHLCNNPPCANTDHLKPVTHAENVRRGDGWAGRNVRKTECPNDHAYTLDNTIITSGGGRRCRSCDSARRHSPRYLAQRRARYHRRKRAS